MTGDKERETIALLAENKQQRLLRHLESLPGHKRRRLLEDLAALDLKAAFRARTACYRPPGPGTLEPGPVIPAPDAGNGRDPGHREAAAGGAALLAAGRAAVLVAAGGQGTRLGHHGPKGTLPVSPVRGKPLFQLLAEQVLARGRTHGVRLPLAIMTSPANRAETEAFFAERGWFGLGREDVYFFEQGVMPAVTPGGQLVLESDTALFRAPDGHGGALRAIYRSGVLAALSGRGVTEIFYCQVDNPLVKAADPLFLGWHERSGAEMSLKVLRRRSAGERVGLYCLDGGRATVVEYSDAPPEMLSARAPDGDFLFRSGSIGIHVFSLAFIRRLNRNGFALPRHRAVKETAAWSPGAGRRKITAWKFETFIFDALPMARRTCCLETLREEEFAPVKNRDGEDSPATSAAAQSGRHRRWLAAAGLEVPPGARVEISPLFALDAEGTAAGLAGAGGLPPVSGGAVYLE